VIVPGSANSSFDNTKTDSRGYKKYIPFET
jgi:hypothetical protein